MATSSSWTKLYNRPGKDALLYHIVRSTEKNPGCQAVIVREGVPIPPFLQCHRGLAEHLYAASKQESPNGPPTIVFLQNSPAALTFTSYEQASEKLVVTGSNYARILDFFGNEFERISSKIQLELGAMKACKDLVRINHHLFFLGEGTCNYTTTLNPHEKEHLKLQIVGNSSNGQTEVFVSYADESLGSIPLNPRVFSILCQCRDQIHEMIDPILSGQELLIRAIEAAANTYKEGPPAKRAHQ
jgi:hypothetical protein